MSRTAASLLREALENVGVRHTFGIPGVHNTEIYDELAKSRSITPVLVTHEGGGAFMADAVSRSGTSLGTLVIVPAAGVTHAASGIAEAFLDGIPMLVIAGGIRRDTDRRYQLHDVDQHAMLKPITKGTWLVERHADVIPTIYEAVRVATSGEPGPVFVEIPVDLQLMTGDPGPAHAHPGPVRHPPPAAAADVDAPRSCWPPRSRRACSSAGAPSMRRREWPRSPSAWARPSHDAAGPERVSRQSPAARRLLPRARGGARRSRTRCATATALLAVGTRFAEIATGSFGYEPPANLVHVDINPARVLGELPGEGGARGRRASRCSAASSRRIGRGAGGGARRAAVAARIAARQGGLSREWLAHDAQGGVNPRAFFQALRRQLADDATRGRGRRQPHLPRRRVDADAPPARLPVADGLQLHGLLRAGHDRRQARTPRARRSWASSATARSA